MREKERAQSRKREGVKQVGAVLCKWETDAEPCEYFMLLNKKKTILLRERE